MMPVARRRRKTRLGVDPPSAGWPPIWRWHAAEDAAHLRLRILADLKALADSCRTAIAGRSPVDRLRHRANGAPALAVHTWVAG
jgi:hypothetical protein